jgi:hypothetical protein
MGSLSSIIGTHKYDACIVLDHWRTMTVKLDMYGPQVAQLIKADIESEYKKEFCNPHDTLDEYEKAQKKLYEAFILYLSSIIKHFSN